ncbi:hypothetical protein P7K49_003870 [Saguinus oedipus]|uniref:Uncharacterized protein n=1 Tax=Saguinus oedipus TaxID=9490 RepID=A0ABQ9W5S3_SAGOE|nr:hypothetical protein P7K49_003870 [Saguinus oedipus]
MENRERSQPPVAFSSSILGHISSLALVQPDKSQQPRKTAFLDQAGMVQGLTGMVQVPPKFPTAFLCGHPPTTTHLKRMQQRGAKERNSLDNGQQWEWSYVKALRKMEKDVTPDKNLLTKVRDAALWLETLKRMSVVVRHPLTGEIIVYTKGADSVIMDLLEDPACGESHLTRVPGTESAIV